MGESALYQTWPGFDTANPAMYQNQAKSDTGRIRRIKTRPSLIQGGFARYFYFPITCKTVFGVDVNATS